MKTNERKLIKMALQGQVMPPICYGWEVTQDGSPLIVPATGGIIYNVSVGDSAYGWVADHIEPGVSCTASRKDLRSNPNKAFNAYSCVGNEARLISGSAKGKKGTVTGHHGGVEHVIIDFPEDVLRKMTTDDKVIIEAYGTGLKVLDAPDVMFFGLAPRLLKKMGVKVKPGGKLEVPVVAVVPPELMGSGIGVLENYMGDYDLQTQDEDELAKHNLDKLCLGDFVALQDQDNRYGFGYRKGAISVGIVIHGNSFLTGHGPGIRVLMTSEKDMIIPKITSKANIASYLNIGSRRK